MRPTIVFKLLMVLTLRGVQCAPQASSVCLTSACKESASLIKENMDPSINPCTDFYSFSCGGFLKKTVIPDEKNSVTSFTAISDDLREKVIKLLEEKIEYGEPRIFQEAKKLYKSCLNTDHLDKIGVEPLKIILKKLGGWPLLQGDSWEEQNTNYKWYSQIPKLRQLGLPDNIFISLQIKTDLIDSRKKTFSLDQPSFGIHREYLIKGLNNSIIKGYLNTLIESAKLIGAHEENIEKELEEVLNFEIQLAQLALSNIERRNVSNLNNPMTIKDLRDLEPSIPWLSFINEILLPEVFSVNMTERIVVYVPSYVRKFQQLIDKTSKRIIANYLGSRVVLSSLTYLDSKSRQIIFDLNKLASGSKKQEDRNKTCARATTAYLKPIVGAMYVRRHFKEKDRKSAETLVATIKNEFESLLNNTEWMDEKTRREALNKLKTMKNHIGYSVELLNDKILNERYENITFNETDYLKNVLNYSFVELNYEIYQLRKEVNKTHWANLPSPAVVDAYYNLRKNLIDFPAAILQGLFFNSDRPSYLNYGSFGWVVGHEITHAFDNQGSQFDHKANALNWWSEKSRNDFKKKTQCLIKQYGKYRVPKTNLTVNGLLTIGENIADNGGVKQAYQSYIKSFGHLNEPTLPGLNYTQRQLFWINAANVWCSKLRPERQAHSILTSVHSPNMFRVIGSFSNRPEFAKDFECKLRSKMNPKSKCNVW